MQRTDMTGVLDFAALHSGSHTGTINSSGPLPSSEIASICTTPTIHQPAIESVASLAAAASEAITLKKALYHQDVAVDISHAYTFARLPGACNECTIGQCNCASNVTHGCSGEPQLLKSKLTIVE